MELAIRLYEQNIAPPIIDTVIESTMMLAFGHPAIAGCESAQSDGRSSLR